MNDDDVEVSRVIAIEEHACTAELRAALLKFGGDDTVAAFSNDDITNRRLLDVDEERLVRMDAAGVDTVSDPPVVFPRGFQQLLLKS